MSQIPTHVERIPPEYTISATGDITWQPNLIDYNSDLFYRGKTVTNAEFNTLFLQCVYQGNYITDSLTELFNQHLSEVIATKVALIAPTIDDTTPSETHPYSSSKVEERLNLTMGDIVLTTSGNTVSVQAKDIHGENLGEPKTISLPDALVSASFDTTNQKLILTLASGNLVQASYASVYQSLQDQIDDLEEKKVNNADFITAEEVDALFD